MSPKNPGPSTGIPAEGRPRHDPAYALLAVGMIVGLLYAGRGVLIPLTLAMMLSLLLAPLVRLLRRLGAGQLLSVLVAVLSFILVVGAVATLLGTQVLRMASSLPRYQQTLQQKLRQVDATTVGRLNVLTNAASRMIDREPHLPESAPSAPAPNLPSEATPIPVQLYAPHTGSIQILERVLASVWPPLETAGIVLMVLVFVLLDHEALRDRFIRLTGGHIRITTIALNDAAERLSRFFVSQFVVNAGVGMAIGFGLQLLGVPHAALWGTLAATLRFIPYVGIWISAAFAAALALALVPGWTLALATVGLFILVELITSQWVEPHLYGHATGLSPLSVVVAAIFWSALWGPMGLILSTPLTLCFVVVGRHIEGLNFLEVLLGDNQALTLPQKFYQRALSGDAHEILRNARVFLERGSLAEYGDRVLMPALQLALFDYQLGAIGKEQRVKIRDVIIDVVGRLGGGAPRRVRDAKARDSVLEYPSAGRALRHHREQREGKWQGPLAVAPGSVIICLSLGSFTDDLAAELLVQILRDRQLDARSFSVDDEVAQVPAGATPGAVALVYLVSAFPHPDADRLRVVRERIRGQLPDTPVVNVLLPGLPVDGDKSAEETMDDHTVTSFVQALQLSLDRPQSVPTV